MLVKKVWLAPFVVVVAVVDVFHVIIIFVVTVNIVVAVLVLVNPTIEGVQILWVGGEGASEAPPKKSMMEWAETLRC